jgi:hypothetical protein
MAVLGEWDVLLPAIARAQGRDVPAPIAAIHGGDFGAAGLSVLLAPFLRGGADPLLVGKLAATAFGAASAALTALLAFRLVPGDRGTPWRLAAGLTTAFVVAWAWPGLHFELMGLSGRTPEALPFQLLATLAALAPLPGRRHALLAGLALGPAMALSPVSIWTALGVLFALLRGARGQEFVARGLTLLIATISLPLITAVGMTDGWEALRLALDPPPRSGAAGPGPWGVLGQLRRALEGGAHQPELRLRPVVLMGLSYLSVVGGLGVLAGGLRRRALSEPRFVAAFLALSWIVPLSILPEDTWFYPLAYRYWCAPLATGLALLAASCTALPRPSAALTLLIITGSAAALVPSLPRSIRAPAPGAAEAMLNTAAHRLGPRPGRPRHAAFLELDSAVPRPLRDAWLLGYGGALGQDLVSDTRDGLPIRPPWEGIRLPSYELRPLVLGVGCGLGAGAGAPVPALSWGAGLDVSDARPLLYGVGICAGDPLRPPIGDPRAPFLLGPALGEAGWRALGRGLVDAGVPEVELTGWAPPAPDPAADWILAGAQGSPWPGIWRPSVPHPVTLLRVRP